MSPSTLRRLAPLGLQLAVRLLQGSLLLATVAVLVTLAMSIASVGGWQSLGRAFPHLQDQVAAVATSILKGQSDALPTMWRGLPKSLALLAVSSLVGTAAGVMLGGLAAVRRDSWFSSLLASVSVLGISTPSYVAAMLLIWSVVWGTRASGARLLPVFGFGWDRHMLLPLLVLAARPAANMLRLTHATLVDINETDYVRTAHSKGLRPGTVFWRHVVRSAGVPLLTSAAVSLRFSLSTLPVVEFIFAWPGVGLSLLQAVQSGDPEAAVVMLLPLVILFVGINVGVSLLYGLLDPRLGEAEDAG